MGILVMTVIVAALLVWLLRPLWRERDRETWEANAAPSALARIQEISAQRIRKEGSGARFKMTVRFSDGFTFVTWANNRRDALDDEFKRKVAAKATTAHRIAVRKKKRGA